MIDKQSSQNKNPNAYQSSPLPESESYGRENVDNPMPNTQKPKPHLQNIKNRFSSWRTRRRERWKDTPLHERETIRLTRVIAFATVCYTIFSGWTLYEIHTGSADTHELAVQAKKQAVATTDLVTAANIQARAARRNVRAARNMAIAAEEQAESAKQIAGQALAQAIATNKLATEAARSAATASRSSPSKIEMIRK